MLAAEICDQVRWRGRFHERFTDEYGVVHRVWKIADAAAAHGEPVEVGRLEATIEGLLDAPRPTSARLRLS